MTQYPSVCVCLQTGQGLTVCYCTFFLVFNVLFYTARVNIQKQKNSYIGVPHCK